MIAKYAFIDATDTHAPGYFGVKAMCSWLGVSASGFFDWRSRPPSARATRRGELAALVEWSFHRSGGTYGYRRVHADLARRGVAVGVDLVRDLMQGNDLVACQPRPFRVTTVPGASDLPDLVQRDFTAQTPGRKLVGDITYIHTWGGFAYLATVIDCYSKTVVGWAVADHMRTSLVIDALAMARRNQQLEAGCIFHSDRGTQGGFNRLSQRKCIDRHLAVTSIRGNCGGGSLRITPRMTPRQSGLPTVFVPSSVDSLSASWPTPSCAVGAAGAHASIIPMREVKYPNGSDKRNVSSSSWACSGVSIGPSGGGYIRRPTPPSVGREHRSPHHAASEAPDHATQQSR